MFGEDEAVAREQQQCRTRGQQSWAKARAGEGCLGPGAEYVSQPQKSKLAEASVFRGSHQPPHRLRFSVFPVITANGGGCPGRRV